MPRFGLDISLDTNPITREGLSAGIYPSNATGTRTYFSSGANQYSQSTFDLVDYPLYYFEVDADGNQYPVQSINVPVVALGVNVAIGIPSAHGNPSVNVVLYGENVFTVDNTADEWFYSKSDIVVSYNTPNIPDQYETTSSTLTYIGGYTPALGWGDYTLAMSHTDANGVVTQASNNDAITAKFQPDTFITEYRLDGVNWIVDVEPIPEVSGYETIDLRYVTNTDYSLDESGLPVYDVDGSIGYVGGTVVTELAVPLATGENSLSIGNIADSGGTLKASAPFLITRIPALRYDGLTTVDEETYGTTYDGALSLIVDEGLANESNVTPDEAPYTFTSGDYRVYNFTASYSYPSGESNSVPVAITYKELALEPLTLLKTRVNEGIDVWVDRDLTAQVGSPVITSVGDTPTSNTNDFYNGIFTAPTGEDYTATNNPIVGDCNLYNGDTHGVKMAGVETVLTHNTDWTVVTVDYVRDKDRGFPWSVGGSDANSLLGVENNTSTGRLNLHWYGNTVDIFYSQITDRTQTLATVNDSVAQEFRLYIDGVLRYTMDTSALTPTTNSLKFVRNARHATMVDDDNFTQGGWIEHIHTRVANYAFDVNDAYAEYRNPNKTPTVQFVGDSVLVWSTAAAYYNQVTDQFFNEGKDLNFLRDGVGGSSLYSSVTSGYLYKIQDGGYVPNVETRPIATSPDRNLDARYAKYKFDAIFYGYTGNYTLGNPAFVYGENGYNDQGYGEYLRAFKESVKPFAVANEIPLFLNSPQPMGDDALTGGTSTRRTDIHYSTMQQLVLEFGDDCLDTFATLATGDNKMPPEYTVDNTHLTDLGNDQLVEPIYNRLYQYYKTANPEVVKTNYTDGIVPASTPMPVTIEYDLDFGVVEARSEDFTLTSGENIITISGVTPQGVPYSQDCPIYYGDLVSDPVSKWAMDSIVGGKILDSVGGNDITVYGTETIADNAWLMSYLDGDYGRIFGSNATMFPRNGSPFSYAVWVKPTVALFTAYIAGMIGASTSGWHALGLQSSMKLERASITNFLVTNGIPALNLNQWNHVAWVTDGTNDNLWINGVKSAQGTLQSPVTALDVLIGCKWNSDDPDSGAPTQNFTGYKNRGWYFDRAMIDAEVKYLNDNEL